MTVYLDLVLLLNFLVDYLLLLGTNRLTGFPSGLGRSAAAAALGGIYAAGCMLPGFAFLGSGLWRMVCLGLMGIMAFGPDQSGWRRTGVFLILAMAMGGVAQGIGRAELPALILSVLCVWFLCALGFGNRVGGKEYVPVLVENGDRSASVIALKDTGNSLRDPITGEQVLVLGPEAAGKLLDLTQAQLENPMETLVCLPQMGLRLIPYNAVGSGGMLLAKRFSDVKIGQRRCSALVAFAPERIGVGEMYQALAGGMV